MTTTMSPSHSEHENVAERRDWKRAWPYTWRSIAAFVGAFVVLTAIYTALGFGVVEIIEPTSIGDAELELAEDLADGRTDFRNTLAKIASFPSDTFVKIALMAILLVVLPTLFRRWHDWAFLLGTLLLEVGVYGASGFIVGRPRPPVERLAEAPTQSWPSGHVAASVAFYVGIAMIVWWHTNKPWPRAIAAIAATVIIIGMVISRLYLGMHYVSDVIGGLVLGAVSLVIANKIIHRGVAEAADDDWPEHTTRLALADPQEAHSS